MSVLDNLDWRKWGIGEGNVTDEKEIALAAMNRLPSHPTVVRAIAVCVAAHNGQYRDKDNSSSPSPYCIHPLAVAIGIFEYMKKTGFWRDVLEDAGRDPLMEDRAANILSAAILHDVLEDCSKDHCSLVVKEFPFTVSVLVMELTKRSDPWFVSLPRSQRKTIDAALFATAPSLAKLIKIFDRLHNLYTWPKNDRFAYGKDAGLITETRRLAHSISFNLKEEDIKMLEAPYEELIQRIDEMSKVDFDTIPL